MSAHHIILASLLPFCKKNYQNWWKFDKVLTKTNLHSFFLRHGVVWVVSVLVFRYFKSFQFSLLLVLVCWIVLVLVLVIVNEGFSYCYC